MKPTEEDIQAELDRHGLGAWSLILGTHVLWLNPTNSRPSISIDLENGSVAISGTSGKAEINVKDVELTDLDNGALNYGFLTSWNAHVLPALRSIVRLITGEQVEQSLEEKVSDLAQKHGIVGYAGKFRSGPDFIAFMVGTTDYEVYDKKLSLQSGERLEIYDIEISALKQDFTERFSEFVVEVAALLTEQPEQTLEEAVRGIVEQAKRIIGKNSDLTFGSADCDYVEFTSHFQRYWVWKDLIRRRSKNKSAADEPNEEFTVDDFMLTTNLYKDVVKELVELLSTRSTKPSYSDLEQRVEELESELSEKGTENCELREEIDRLKESKRQIAETKSRILENYNQLASVDGQKTDRITDLEAQLQDYISPADHERELEKYQTAFEGANRAYKKQLGISEKYLSWFHREYAKNAELESSGLKSVVRSLS